MIRKMRREDLEQVVQLEAAIFSEPWSRRGFEDSMDKPDNLYLVCEEQGEILAYCGLWGVAGEGQICNVAVKPEARNRGIAFRMLTELIHQGNDMGLDSYTLEVRAGNQAAVRVYHKLGFQDAGVRKGFYSKPAEDALIMWKYPNETQII